MNLEDLTPTKIVEILDRRVVGQNEAKRAIAIAIRNRWRREQLPPAQRRLCKKQNILLKGPTGSGKTELARAVAEELQWPIHFVDITQYTESGYQGKELNDIVKEFADSVRTVPDWARVGGAETPTPKTEDIPEVTVWVFKLLCDSVLLHLSGLRSSPVSYADTKKITAKEAKELSGSLEIKVTPGSVRSVLETCWNNLTVDEILTVAGMNIMYQVITDPKRTPDGDIDYVALINANHEVLHVMEPTTDTPEESEDVMLGYIACVNDTFKLKLRGNTGKAIYESFTEKMSALLVEAKSLKMDLVSAVYAQLEAKSKYPELLRFYARIAQEYLLSWAKSCRGIKFKGSLSKSTVSKDGARALSKALGVRVEAGALKDILERLLRYVEIEKLREWVVYGYYTRLHHFQYKVNGMAEIHEKLRAMGMIFDEEPADVLYVEAESCAVYERIVLPSRCKDLDVSAGNIVSRFDIKDFDVADYASSVVIDELVAETLPPLFEQLKSRGSNMHEVYVSTILEKEKKGTSKTKGAKLSIVEFIEQYGIIFIDEIDKLGEETGSKGMVSRSGVQRGLLALTEGTDISTKLGTISTDNVLFIGAGAFAMTSIDRLMPELRGRFPLVANIHKLTHSDYVKILKSEHSAIRGCIDMCRVEGVKLTVADDCYDLLADRCVTANEQTNLGARRLHDIVSEAFQDIMFNAEKYKGTEVIYSKETLEKNLSVGKF